MRDLTLPGQSAPTLMDVNPGVAAMCNTTSVGEVAMSFGAFKPVGWVFMGVPTQAGADALATALHGAGWSNATLQHFHAGVSAAELEALADKAEAMTGFGYEITLLRRYAALAREGYRWLLVKVADDDHAAHATEVARGCGATLAVHYRKLTIEELI